jgi:hypothetical protein
MATSLHASPLHLFASFPNPLSGIFTPALWHFTHRSTGKVAAVSLILFTTRGAAQGRSHEFAKVTSVHDRQVGGFSLQLMKCQEHGAWKKESRDYK